MPKCPRWRFTFHQEIEPLLGSAHPFDRCLADRLNPRYFEQAVLDRLIGEVGVAAGPLGEEPLQLAAPVESNLAAMQCRRLDRFDQREPLSIHVSPSLCGQRSHKSVQ